MGVAWCPGRAIGTKARAEVRVTSAVEPEVADLRHIKRLSRFMLRGMGQVRAQWQLFWRVHNIENLARSRWVQ